MSDYLPPPPEETPQPAPKRVKRAQKRNPRPYNVLTLLFMIGTCGVIAYFAYIWQYPYSALNPLAPPTPLPLIVTATLEPSPTFTPSQTFTPSRTPLPTLTPTETPIPVTPTDTPIFIEGFSTPEGTPPGEPVDYPFELQRGQPIYITNPEGRGGCRWSSIAGSVMGADGRAIDGYGVRIIGEALDQTIATGSAPGFGPGGFELQLGTEAIDAEYVAQLLDESGNPISPVYTVQTRSDCALNIAALRFVERRG